MADVASKLSSWSTTLGSNNPQTSTTIGTGLAPNFQQIQATLRTELGSRSTSVTAAATTDLSTKDEGIILVTNAAGTVAITSFGTLSAGMRKLVTFVVSGGTLTITYNATSMILPGATNITVSTGDSLVAESLGAGNWKVHSYARQDGTPVVSTAAPFIDSTAIIKGSGDATKLFRIEADGISTSTTRVATVPNNDFTFDNSKIQSITASVAASALTITINPTTLDFRSTTLGSGTVTTINLSTAVSVVVPSTATLGTVNAVQSRLAVLLINNAGTLEAAVVNIAGGTDLSETGVISTTAIAAASNSATVIYSTTARTSVAYRVVGYVESTQATAGTWATAPSTIQGYGGQALAALSSIGFGQVPQTVTRTTGTTYYNTTGKPIGFNISALASGISGQVNISINGATAFKLIDGNQTAGTYVGTGFTIIPVGASYVLSETTIASHIVTELR